MRAIRPNVTVCGAVVALTVVGGMASSAAADARGEALLGEGVARLHAASTYTADVTTSVKVGIRPARLSTGRLAAMKPNFLRVEMQGAGAVTTVCDGACLYIHAGGDRTYYRMPAPANPSTIAGRWEAEIDGFFGGPSVVANVPVESAGSGNVAGVPCRVVRAHMNDPRRTVTYVIGMADHLIHRAVIATPGPDGTAVISNTLANIRLNAPIAAERFAYMPPAGLRSTEPASPEARLVAVGQAAPDFAVAALDGSQLPLSDLLKDKKAVLVAFWTYGSSACRAELPRLQAMFGDLGEKGLQVIAIDRGDDHDAIARYVQENSLTLPIGVGHQPDGRDSDVFDEYGVSGLPTTYLLDGSGKVIWRAAAFSEPTIRAVLKGLGVE